MVKEIFRGARELASYTGFTENAIHILVARGALPVHRHGKLLIFVKQEIDAFFASLPGVTATEALRVVADKRGAAERRGSKCTRLPRHEEAKKNSPIGGIS